MGTATKTKTDKESLKLFEIITELKQNEEKTTEEYQESLIIELVGIVQKLTKGYSFRYSKTREGFSVFADIEERTYKVVLEEV
jgi:hypothetical protein